MMSTPAQKTMLVDLIREMKVRALGKNPKLGELVEWVVRELPQVAPDDPRTRQSRQDRSGTVGARAKQQVVRRWFG